MINERGQSHLESDRDGDGAGDTEASVHGRCGDPCLWRSSRAKAWRSPEPVDEAEPVPPYWRGSICLCCMAHEVCATIGSKSDDKSYVAGTEEADGRSDIERGGAATSVCDGGGGGGGGDGSSSVVK